MRGSRGFCLAWLLAYCLFLPSFSYSAALPGYTGVMNASIGSIIKYKAAKWGFALTDAKIKATAVAVGTALTGLAIGGGGMVLATATWPAVLAGAGISALLSGAVSLGVDAAEQWLWGTGSDEGNVKLSGSALPSGNKADFPVMTSTWPQFFTAYGVGQDIWLQPTSGTTPRHVQTFRSVCNIGGGTTTFCVGALQSPSQSPCTYNSTPVTGNCTPSVGPYPGANGYWSASNRTASVTTASHLENGVTVIDQTVSDNAWDFIAPTSAPLTYPGYVPAFVTPGQAIADTPQSQTGNKLSDAQLAAAVNAAWRRAGIAAPIPWSASDPITPGDVASWRSTHPQEAPTVNDFFQPVAAPGSPSVDIPLPGESSVITNPGTPIDLGPNPNISSPVLETTPTADSILAPVFNLMPDLRAFTLPAHASTCPVAVIDLRSYRSGWNWTVNGHCNMINDNAAIISAALLLCWSLSAVFIVLRA